MITYLDEIIHIIRPYSNMHDFLPWLQVARMPQVFTNSKSQRKNLCGLRKFKMRHLGKINTNYEWLSNRYHLLLTLVIMI